jgi:hypothetical protein
VTSLPSIKPKYTGLASWFWRLHREGGQYPSIYPFLNYQTAGRPSELKVIASYEGIAAVNFNKSKSTIKKGKSGNTITRKPRP